MLREQQRNGRRFAPSYFRRAEALRFHRVRPFVRGGPKGEKPKSLTPEAVSHIKPTSKTRDARSCAVNRVHVAK
jgi:hypothetical protein